MGAGLHRGDLYSLARWLAELTDTEARLNCLECRRMGGMDVLGGACSVSTGVQLTPPPPPSSSPPLGYRASPKVSSCQTGQDLDLVAAHGEPRYDIGIGLGLAPLARWPLLLSCCCSTHIKYLGTVPPAGSGSLGQVGAFPCSLRRNFLLPSTWSILRTHTCTHTSTHTRAHLFSSLPQHPTLQPPTTTPT